MNWGNQSWRTVKSNARKEISGLSTHHNAILLAKLRTILDHSLRNIINCLAFPKPQVHVRRRHVINMKPYIFRPPPPDQLIIFVFIRSHIDDIWWRYKFTLVVKHHVYLKDLQRTNPRLVQRTYHWSVSPREHHRHHQKPVGETTAFISRKKA